MSIHLLYRTPYNELNHKYYKKFEGDNLLEWFQNLWKLYDKDVDIFDERINKYIGNCLYGFWITSFSESDSEDLQEVISNAEPPKTMEEVVEYIKNGYVVDVQLLNPNAVQIQTEDDEMYLAYYFFNDGYCQENLEITSYLIHNIWELPEEYSSHSNFEPSIEFGLPIIKGNGIGTTYITISSSQDSENIVFKIDGVRVGSFIEYLSKTIPDEHWEYDLLFLRSQIEDEENDIEKTFRNYGKIPELYIQSIPSLKMYHGFDITMLMTDNYLVGKKYVKEFYEDVFKSSGLGISRKDIDSKFQFSEHLVQASIYIETWDSHPTHDIGEEIHLFDHWIIFDDLWATQNKNLANSILNYGSRWNALK
jgi:hypothetical protein